MNIRTETSQAGYREVSGSGDRRWVNSEAPMAHYSRGPSGLRDQGWLKIDSISYFC